MPLETIELEVAELILPSEVREFLDEADARIEQYYQNKTVRPTGFVPSDFVAVYHTLRAVVENNLSTGNSFCEWGSGFGVVASLAALLEFEAYGIEINDELVDASRDLAEDFELPVEFVAGSFVPRGGESVVDEAYAENGAEIFCLVTESDNAYEELGQELDEFDMFFAYPWPGEESAYERLFENYAAEGALLLMYDKLSSVRILRQVGAS
jgi:hypothetical protein